MRRCRYDPRQGPQPNGYLTAQDYLADTKDLIAAVRGVGAKAGVVVAPCPFFYPEGSPCWGGVDGRYHQWQRNISAACQGSTAAQSSKDCPFDAVIAHNYVVDVSVIKPFEQEEFLGVYLSVPQVTTDYGAATMAREFGDGVSLWITEFNVMYVVQATEHNTYVTPFMHTLTMCVCLWCVESVNNIFFSCLTCVHHHSWSSSSS